MLLLPVRKIVRFFWWLPSWGLGKLALTHTMTSQLAADLGSSVYCKLRLAWANVAHMYRLKVKDSETVQVIVEDMQAYRVYIWAEIRWHCLSHVSATWKVQFDSLENRECSWCSRGGDLRRQWGSFFLFFPTFSSVSQSSRKKQDLCLSSISTGTYSFTLKRDFHLGKVEFLSDAWRWCWKSLELI